MVNPGGGVNKSEKLNITLFTNQNIHTDILGAIISISYSGMITQYTWEGKEITVEIPSQVTYTIEYSDIDGYSTPVAFSSASVAGNARTIEAEYKTEVLTVNVSSDKGSISDYEITISKYEMVGKSTKYIKLEYIESTGSGQYIDTNYKPNQNTRVVFSGYNTSSSSGWTFGCWYNSTSKQYAFSCNKDFSFRYGSLNVSLSTVSVGPLNVDFNKNNYSMNGISGSFESQTFTSDYNMYLFAINNKGTVSSGKYIGRIYFCKIYDNGAVVRDFIPALRSDGVTGLYDTINDEFYTSMSATNFAPGPSLINKFATQNLATSTYKIPHNVGYLITANDIPRYNTPQDISRIASAQNYVATMEYVQKPAKDLSMYDTLGNSINQSTANCYVIKETGTYKFPAVYGNAIKNGQNNPASYYSQNKPSENLFDFVNAYGNVIDSPYIVEGNRVQLSISDTDHVFTDINLISEGDLRYIQFSISTVPHSGANGIISLCDDEGAVWNWHIWVWPHDLTPVYLNTRYSIMPVNLATKLDDDIEYGEGEVGYKSWFYQWGRSVPLLCASNYAGVSNHTSYGELELISSSVAATDYTQGIRNPTTFYHYADSQYYNWYDEIPCYNLWDSACATRGMSDNDVIKTIYDPCPVGWKIPNGRVFAGFSKNNIIGEKTYGLTFVRYSGDTTGVFFPYTGYRYGSGSPGSGAGYAWTSATTNSLSHVYRLGFDGTSYVGNTLVTEGIRTYGFSVRPVVDNILDDDMASMS